MTCLRFETPNGGGYGSPCERDPEAVLLDVLDGYVTVEEARTQYAVVIDASGEAVDGPATAALRAG